MWPFYFLLNKILKTDEEDGEDKGEDHVNVTAGCCSFELPSDNQIGPKAVFHHSHFVQVPHINQLFSWDCGLACVLMVLTTVGINDCSIQTLAELCCTTRFSYYTVTLGANPNYSSETYYKEQLPNDLVRVDKLFQKAVECRSIRGEEISRWILSGKYIVIALVDQYKWSQSWVGDLISPGYLDNVVGYTGHYVVICGYDAKADEFEIRDPASSRKHDRVSSKSLEEAHKSFGTDEDLLLCTLEYFKLAYTKVLGGVTV